jgi:F-type H+-transporting ATPase subunit b
MQIDWWTLLLQAINFLVLVWLLWRFLYKPVKEVIEKRKRLAGEAFAEADRQKQEAEAARQRFEDDRAGLMQERQQMLKKTHADLEKERGQALEDARRQADELLEDARQSIAKERAAALTEIRQQATTLAVELATGVLRQTQPEGGAGVFLERLEKQLGDMPAAERERLQHDLSAEGAVLEVVTAAPLAAEEQKGWARRLGAGLAQEDQQEDKIRFAVDPEILGGAELHFPHAVLKFTWADQLRKAKELLQSDEAAS